MICIEDGGMVELMAWLHGCVVAAAQLTLYRVVLSLDRYSVDFSNSIAMTGR
jgi:hypothetical protein